MMSPAGRDPDVTVILATRDRAALVEAAVRRALAQDTGGAFTYEVLVVDNGSADDTGARIGALAAGAPVPVRCVVEPRPGKSWALNTGIRQARGAWLVLLDDDIVTPPGWLAALWRCAADEAADAVTGRVLPQWDSPVPAWLADAASRHLNQMGLGCVDHGDQRRRTAHEQDCRWVGGNLAIRRDQALAVGAFNTDLARGQDSDYYNRCVARGLRIVYEPAAAASHRIGADRLTPGAFRRWRHRQGRYEAMLLPWKPSHVLTILPLWRWRATFAALAAWVGALVRGRSRWERFYAELKLREQLGALAYRLQHWPGRRAHG